MTKVLVLVGITVNRISDEGIVRSVENFLEESTVARLRSKAPRCRHREVG